MSRGSSFVVIARLPSGWVDGWVEQKRSGCLIRSVDRRTDRKLRRGHCSGGGTGEEHGDIAVPNNGRNGRRGECEHLQGIHLLRVLSAPRSERLGRVIAGHVPLSRASRDGVSAPGRR